MLTARTEVTDRMLILGDRPGTYPGVAYSSLPQPLASPMLAEGTPRLGLVALIGPGLAPGRCLHLLGQLLRAAGCDKRPLAADRDPHAFQGIKQNAPPGEPGPELACVVSRMGVVVWHGTPHLAESQPVSQHRHGEPGPLWNGQITLTGVPPMPGARILAAVLVVRT